jgi:hypothetical protein
MSSRQDFCAHPDWLHPSLALDMRRVAWATIVALVSGVIGLAGGYLAVKSGYPFSAERRDEQLNAGYAGELAYDFATLQSVVGAEPATAPPVRAFGRAATVPGESGREMVSAQPVGPNHHCTVGGWPYFDSNCPGSDEAGKRHRGRLTLRLKSPWCSSAFHHQIFFSCRSRT